MSTFSVAQLIHLADYLNVEIGHLFSAQTTTDPTEDIQPSDVETLGAMLLDLRQITKTKAVCEVLGWNSTKLHKVATTLNEHLAPAGLTLHHVRGTLRMAPLDGSHQEAADKVRKHPLATINQRILTPERARILYEMEIAPKSNHSMSDTSRRNLALMYRVGLIEEDGIGNFIVSDAVLRSLHPEGFTRVEAVNNKKTAAQARVQRQKAERLLLDDDTAS